MDALGVARALDAVAVGSAGQFVQGAVTAAHLVPEQGGVVLHGMDFWPQPDAAERLKALQKLLAADRLPATGCDAGALVRGQCRGLVHPGLPG